MNIAPTATKGISGVPCIIPPLLYYTPLLSQHFCAAGENFGVEGGFLYYPPPLFRNTSETRGGINDGTPLISNSYENIGFSVMSPDFARLFGGTLSIVLHFYGIKNVHVGLLEVFAFGKIDLVGTADLF